MNIALIKNSGNNRIILLISTLLSATLPHFLHLPYWLTALILSICIWSGINAKKYKLIPSTFTRITLVFIVIAGVTGSYGTILGRDAGVALLICMLSLKILEIKSFRDEMLFLFMAYFLVITNFLYSQTALMAIYMLAIVVWNTAILLTVNHAGKVIYLQNNIKTSAIMVLQSIPVMLVLFVLFPRIPGPLWSLPKDAHSGVTGLGDSMSPGNISNLIRSEAVAFRASFQSDMPAKDLLYWRGPVLWDFDGQSWTTSKNFHKRETRFIPNGPPTNYTVTIEPHNKHWLFAIDLPAISPVGSTITSDYMIHSSRPVSERKQYNMLSHTRWITRHQLSLRERNRALALPSNSNPQTRAYAEDLRKQFNDPGKLVARVLQKFSNEPYIYTLKPPLLTGHMVDKFLFNTRRGFCEHYASSFVFLMRAAGIPARVVTGYQGGEFNEIGNYLIVRQSDAHAWSEVWLEDRGWVRIDPTAAVSPARIESGINGAIPGREYTGGLIRSDNALFRKMVLFWDSFDNKWNQWILGYGDTTQIKFLEYLGFSDIDWKKMTIGFTLIIIFMITILSISMMLKNRTAPMDVPLNIYNRFCRKMSRTGITRRSYEGPMDYYHRAACLRPDLQTSIQHITDLYISIRYGNNETPETLKQLRVLISNFDTSTQSKLHT